MTRKLAGHFFLFEAGAAFTELLEVSTGNCGHGRKFTFWNTSAAGKDPVELVQGCIANEPPDGPELKSRRGNEDTQCNSAIAHRQHKPASHFAFGETGITYWEGFQPASQPCDASELPCRIRPFRVTRAHGEAPRWQNPPDGSG